MSSLPVSLRGVARVKEVYHFDRAAIPIGIYDRLMEFPVTIFSFEAPQREAFWVTEADVDSAHRDLQRRLDASKLIDPLVSESKLVFHLTDDEGIVDSFDYVIPLPKKAISKELREALVNLGHGLGCEISAEQLTFTDAEWIEKYKSHLNVDDLRNANR